MGWTRSERRHDIPEMSVSRSRVLVCVLSITMALAAGPGAALAADNVLTDDQIFQGNLCLGPPCADAEDFGTIPFHIKRGDTPAIRFNQTAGGFTPQTWDVAGNEANFFVRDLTGGSRLPFRIRPGALTSQIDMLANGVTTITGVAQQTNNRDVSPTPYDESTILGALRTLPFERYTIAGDATVHFAPTPTTFNTAFGLSTSTSTAFMDMSAIALAGLKQLDQRVEALASTPGTKGDAGAAGPAGAAGQAGPIGATGATGATGAAGMPASTAALAAANKRIAALEKTNKAQAKSLAKLQKQMQQLLARR